MRNYVHGYSDEETERLSDQANTLAALLHGDTYFPSGSTILEAGCGTGAQTVLLARSSPRAQFTAIDISTESIRKAKAKTSRNRINNVRFQIADIYDLPFEPDSFDHVFVCFVLEHLGNPLSALNKLYGVLKKGGSITVIEGDHGSFYCHPQSREASVVVHCLIEIQSRLKGNSLI